MYAYNGTCIKSTYSIYISIYIHSYDKLLLFDDLNEPHSPLSNIDLRKRTETVGVLSSSLSISLKLLTQLNEQQMPPQNHRLSEKQLST